MTSDINDLGDLGSGNLVDSFWAKRTFPLPTIPIGQKLPKLMAEMILIPTLAGSGSRNESI